MASAPASAWRAFAARFAIALVAVLVLAATGVGGAYWYANRKVDEIATVAFGDGVLREGERGEPANFLIIGSDTREENAKCNDPNADERFGSAADLGGRRSDTIMIAHVDPDTETGLLVSFPRDLWVNIPGRGEARINSAFNDGPQAVVDTIEANFDVPIDHYLEVNFCGFQGIVDAIGTVPIFFPTAVRDTYTGLHFLLPGCFNLNGAEALSYVRSRHYQYKETGEGDWQNDGTGDFGRIRRQQYFIRSLADVALKTAARHPLKANNIANKVVDNLVIDENLGLSDLLALANTFRNVDPAALEMVTVPSDGGNRDGQSVVLLRDAEAEALFERLRSFGSEPVEPEIPTDIAPGEVSVRVLNGSGVSGQARATMDTLAGVGFAAVEAPTDADRANYQQTEVRYSPGAERKARLVTAYLGGVGVLTPLDAADAADVVVVTGDDFTGVVAPAAPGSSAPPATVTPPTTIPANPGRTPGITAPSDPNGGLPAVGC